MPFGTRGDIARSDGGNVANVRWREVLSGFAFIRIIGKLLVLIRLPFLTRILSPAELGNLGLALLAVAIGEVATETGINLLFLREHSLLAKWRHSAWLISALRGSIIALFLVGIALLVRGSSYNLAELIAWSALIPLMRGLIHPDVIQWQLRGQMAVESGLRSGLMVIDVLVGWFLVMHMQSAIAIVFGILISVVMEVAVSWLSATETIKWQKIQLVHIRNILLQTKKLLPNGIINYLTEHLDDLLIGSFLGSVALGIYQTGYKLAASVTVDVGGVIGQSLSNLSGHHTTLVSRRKLWMQSTLLLLSLFIPVTLVSLISTPQNLVALLGNEWGVVAPILPWLLVGGWARSFIAAWNALAVAIDRSLSWFVLQSITAIGFVMAVLVTVNYNLSIQTLASFIALAWIIPLPIGIYLMAKWLPNK